MRLAYSHELGSLACQMPSARFWSWVWIVQFCTLLQSGVNRVVTVFFVFTKFVILIANAVRASSVLRFPSVDRELLPCECAYHILVVCCVCVTGSLLLHCCASDCQFIPDLYVYFSTPCRRLGLVAWARELVTSWLNCTDMSAFSLTWKTWKTCGIFSSRRVVTLYVERFNVFCWVYFSASVQHVIVAKCWHLCGNNNNNRKLADQSGDDREISFLF